MALITSINNLEAGSSVRAKINTAMASVETDATISGDGLVGTPLSVSVANVDHNSLQNYSAAEHYVQSAINTVGTVTTGTLDGGDSTGRNGLMFYS